MGLSVAVSIVKHQAGAKEVVQSAFVQAYKSLGSFKHKSLFSTWFYRIVVNEGLKYNRKNKGFETDVRVDMTDAICLRVTNDAIIQLDLEDKKEEINRVFMLMKPKERLILNLYYLKEFSLKEIADITGFTEGNIKILLHRARKNFAGFFNLEY